MTPAPEAGGEKMQITCKQLDVIQDALWSRMKKHGKITKKDFIAMKIIGEIVEFRIIPAPEQSSFIYTSKGLLKQKQILSELAKDTGISGWDLPITPTPEQP